MKTAKRKSTHGSGRNRGINSKGLNENATAALFHSDCADLSPDVVYFARMVRDLRAAAPVLKKKISLDMPIALRHIALRHPLMVVLSFLERLADGAEEKTFLEVAKAFRAGADKGAALPGVAAMIYAAADAAKDHPEGITAADVAERIEKWNLQAQHVDKPDTLGRKLKQLGFKTKGRGAPKGW